MVLADLGARVIKVEPPGGGDDARAIGPFVGDRSAYFMSLNRGKQSIALDLKNPDDRAIFEPLLARADVLVENFRLGVMDRLGASTSIEAWQVTAGGPATGTTFVVLEYPSLAAYAESTAKPWREGAWAAKCSRLNASLTRGSNNLCPNDTTFAAI